MLSDEGPGRRATARTARALLLGGLLGALALTGCTSAGGRTTASSPAAPAASASDTASPGGSGTASPGGTETAAPGGTASPSASGTAGPGGTATPFGSASPRPSGSGSAGGGSPVQVSCAVVTVVRTGRVSVAPARTTEVATVVSDGRSLTPGSRQQTDFASPVLTAPGGGTVTDPGTLQQVARLVEATRHRVLLERPPAPDEDLDASKRPFSSPGTYAVYNASGLVSAEAVVQCAGQEQTWVFSAEADPTTGQVNCAVEPARSNALARVVFAQSC